MNSLLFFSAKIEQVIHTLENNEEELALLNENLGEDYLTRARAAAYVLERHVTITRVYLINVFCMKNTFHSLMLKAVP